MAIVEKYSIEVSKDAPKTKSFGCGIIKKFKKTVENKRIFKPKIPFSSKTALQVLYENGSLSHLKEYSPIDLYSAGYRLYRSFYLAGLDQLYCKDLAKPIVDNSFTRHVDISKLDAEDEFRKASKSVSRHFFPVVYRIVIEDLPIVANDERTQIGKYKVYQQKVDLCRGLAELYDYYVKAR